jgi:3-dehydro-L-gulonate 2-dehydrogenase
LGNNPLVIAVPRREGPVVLDMAMSQFSYGQLSSFQMSGKQLPVIGGYDLKGQLTQDPGAIEESKRPLPIGYWKGSGMALLLDLMAAMLSGGQATHQISRPDFETGLSQVFIAVNLTAVDQNNLAAEVADHHCKSADKEGVRYPGENVLKTRRESRTGHPAEQSAWDELRTL